MSHGSGTDRGSSDGDLEASIFKAAELLRKSKRTVAFTGAGISVESGKIQFLRDTRRARAKSNKSRKLHCH